MNILAFIFCIGVSAHSEVPTVRIGSKAFTEGYILSEILAQKLELTGVAKVERKFGMGGTGILYESLKSGAIDIYPEYTGTLSLTLLQEKSALPLTILKSKLRSQNLEVSPPLGFDNSFGLAVSSKYADKIKKLSDLTKYPELRMAFSYEFMERNDGYPALAKYYSFPAKPPIRMDHALVYTALETGQVDVIEVYTTDAKIEKLGLSVVEDDRGFFPKYEGLFVYRNTLLKHPEVIAVLDQLKNSLSSARMRQLNSLVEIQHKTFAEAASTFFPKQSNEIQVEDDVSLLLRLTKRHLLLVMIPVIISLLIGVPMGILSAKVPVLSRFLLIFSGIFQTIPALALLCFLIPLLGIGLVPSMTALILYSLLPIVRSTHSGLLSLDPRYREVAEVLGLNSFQRLIRIELPLASISILGGIQTAAVINVGMATLAAFIGAGGYGSLIVTGLALNDNVIILKGALPATVMAIFVHLLFEIFERILTPRGLRP